MGVILACHLLEEMPERVRELVQDQRLEMSQNATFVDRTKETSALEAKGIGRMGVDEEIRVRRPSGTRSPQHVLGRRVLPMFSIASNVDWPLDAIAVQQIGKAQTRQALDLDGASG